MVTQIVTTQNHSSWSPPVQLTPLLVGERGLYVAREDLLPGGTKQRAIIPFLIERSSYGAREFVYAGPFCGFAQIALAVSCHALRLKARLFCEADPVTGGAHAYSKLAQDWGAEISLHSSLAQAELAARTYASKRDERCYHIPLGFAHPRYLELLGRELSGQLLEMESQLGTTPRRLWLPIGSGTLARAFASSLNPRRWSLVCVDVRVLPPEDARIRHWEMAPEVEFKRVPERFAEPAVELPQLPSNLHYDAKLWRHFASEGRDGDVWWNVAR